MNLLESLLYGLVSGFTEILPVSAAAHGELFKRLFGIEGELYLPCLLARLAILGAVIFQCKTQIAEIYNVQTPSGKRKNRGATVRTADMRLVRTAAVPMLLGFFLWRYAEPVRNNLLLLVPALIVNGLILYIPSRMLSGNKNAKAMSGWDGLLMGLCGVMGIVPGISRIGAIVSAACARGADKKNAINWALLLCIPALAVLLCLDIYGFMTVGGVGFSSVGVFCGLFTLIGAAAGSFLGIYLMRFLAVKVGYSAFSYYSWGAALFIFVMYLVVV